MADLDEDQQIQMLQLLQAKRGRRLQKPNDATFGEKAAEVGRFVGRGVRDMGEGLLDLTWDVGMAALPRPGVAPVQTVKNVLNELNPFGGEEDGADATRQEFYDGPLMQSLTQEKIAPGNMGLDMAKTAGEWAPTLIDPTKSKLTRKIATVIMGSGGAAVGGELGGEVGEVVGGIIGAISGNKTGQAFDGMVKWMVDRKGASLERAEQAVAKFFKDNATDINASIETVAEGTAFGERGTTAQLAADTGMFGIEAGANTTTPAIVAQRAARQGRTDQIIDDVKSAFGPELVGADRALPQAADRVAAQVGASKGRLSQAVANEAHAGRIAEARRSQVAPTGTTFETSENLASTLDTTQAAYDSAFKTPAWKEFDALRGKSGAIDSAPFKADLEKGLRSLNPTQRSVFNDTYMKEFNYINGLNKTISPSEAHFLISRIKTITGNAARTNNTTATEAFLTDIGVRLERTLRSSPEAGQLYDNAIAATKESSERFNARNVGTARLDPNIETLGSRVVVPGDKGAATARDLERAGPEVIEQTGQYLRSLAAREGLDAKFIDKYEGFLSRFPDQALVAELRSSAAAETGLTQAIKAAEQAAKTEAKVQSGLTKTAIAEFSTKPAATMKNLLTKPDSAARLDELLNSLDNPAAARDAFRETFVARISKKVGGENVVTPASIDEFDRVYPALQRLFADVPDELQAIQTAVERSTVDMLRKSVPGQRLVESVDELDSLIASGAAATILTTGGFSGTHALMVGGAVRRAIMRLISKSELDPAKMEVLSDMVSNPEEFLRIMNSAPAPTPNADVMTRVTSALDAMIQPGFAGFINADTEG